MGSRGIPGTYDPFCPPPQEDKQGAPHSPDEPLAVRWWREDRWTFVGVLVEVTDPDGRVWGCSSLWGTEAGTFPYKIEEETGAVESREIDPVTDEHHPVPDLIHEAAGLAQQALSEHATQRPVITGPPDPEPTGQPAPSSTVDS